MAIFLATLALVFSAITVALWLGESPEKTGAKIILAQVLINVIGHRILAFHYVKIDPVSAFVDAIGMIGFCAIALYARRIWPLWLGSGLIDHNQ